MFASLVRTASLVAILLLPFFAAGQTQWSAVVVDTRKEGTPIDLRIYFGGDKVRLEPQIWVRGNVSGPFILFDRATRTGIVVVPENHAYAGAPPQWIEKYRGFAADWNIDTFRAGWLRTPENQSGTCKQLSDEAVNGRTALRYEATNSNGEMTRFWFDRKLRMMVKWETRTNGGEMRNIEEAPQPASLFEIPAGYTKGASGIVQSATPK